SRTLTDRKRCSVLSPRPADAAIARPAIARPRLVGKTFQIPHGDDDGVQRLPMELEGITVLVVEDDEDTREVMRAMLELCGARVLVAESAKSGLEAFEKARPDAIVSDIAMPGEDGYWLVREVARRMNERDVAAVAGAAVAGDQRASPR